MQVIKYERRVYERGKITPVDRTIRTIVGAALIVIAFLWVRALVAQVILWVLGGTLVLEGLSAWCPMTFMRNRAAFKKQA